MKVIVCDDEELCREEEVKLCKEYFVNKDLTADIISLPSGEALIAHTEKVDLIILDIEMNGINGIEVKDILVKQNRNSAIIYVTSHDELIKPAFGRNVYGFLSKPVCREEMYRILDVIYKDRVNLQLINFDNEWIRIIDIKYIFAEDKYCRIHMADTNYLIRSRITDWEQRLPSSDFIRIQKSCILNFKFVKKIAQEITMKDNVVLTYSRKKKELIKQKYNKYLIEHAW